MKRKFFILGLLLLTCAGTIIFFQSKNENMPIENTAPSIETGQEVTDHKFIKNNESVRDNSGAQTLPSETINYNVSSTEEIVDHVFQSN